MRLVELWRYPVKSMMGEQVEQATLAPLGLEGDRGWAVRDEERGGIRGAKKIGGLMRFSARYVDDHAGPVEISTPDGATLRTDADDIDSSLSEALDHRVTLWPLQPADDLDHYRRGAADSDDLLVELRDIFGRDDDEPLPDLSVFPEVILEYETPPGTYVDAFPLLVMTTSALAALAAALPGSQIDVRRFRPNLVVDSDEPGHPELGWEGRRLQVGEAVLELTVACPRCVMVTLDISSDLPADRAVLRHIVRELDQNVGIYANVVMPGPVAIDDPVVLLD